MTKIWCGSMRHSTSQVHVAILVPFIFVISKWSLIYLTLVGSTHPKVSSMEAIFILPPLNIKITLIVF